MNVFKILRKKQSSLSSKYDNLLEATQGANQKNTRAREVAKGFVKVARITYLCAPWLCFWITFFGGNDLTAFYDFSARLGLFSSAKILQIADVALRVVF